MDDTEENEIIVFIARETGWSLEYIRELPNVDLKLIVRELRYQKMVDEYRALRGIALALTVWANSQPKRTRTFRLEDFIGDQPKRDY